MTRLRWRRISVAVCLLLFAAGHALAAEAAGSEQPPNILLILADDMTYSDCEPYGSPDVKTPNLRRLAKEGMRFDNAFTATAMCSPTRQQLYTGIYPVRNGAYPNQSRVYPKTRSLVHYLGNRGYRVALSGKLHVGPPESFPFEILKRTEDWEPDSDAMEEFINRDPDQPYCLIAASHHPHEPWNSGDRGAYAPESLTVPPYLVDTETTRWQLAAYDAEITELDREVGDWLRLVDRSPHPENTIVIFTSEQGSSMPFGGKWTCYDTGLKTAFLVRWPARVPKESATDAMIAYVDVVPTLLDAAGIDPRSIDTGLAGAPDGGKGFDGRSFLQVLLGKRRKHRKYVFGVQTSETTTGATPYPIRSIRSRRYKLIWNLLWKTAVGNLAVCRRRLLGAWWNAGPVGQARAAAFERRPEWELYDLDRDPWELHNVAGRRRYRFLRRRLRRRLEAFLRQQGDEGVATELRAPERLYGYHVPLTAGRK